MTTTIIVFLCVWQSSEMIIIKTDLTMSDTVHTDVYCVHRTEFLGTLYNTDPINSNIANMIHPILLISPIP